VVATGTHCLSNSQISVVRRAIPLQDIHACLCVPNLFIHSMSDGQGQTCFHTVRLPVLLCDVRCSRFISGSDGIAASITISVINYVLLGFQFPVDAFYLHSFEIWLATVVVFFGSGNVGFTLLEYRLGEKNLVGHARSPSLYSYSPDGFKMTSLFINICWIPFL
jgi:hypothetical protein